MSDVFSVWQEVSATPVGCATLTCRQGLAWVALSRRLLHGVSLGRYRPRGSGIDIAVLYHVGVAALGELEACHCAGGDDG
jgi:hypothetical protein